MAQHLRAVHHVDVEYVSVSALGSCGYNAKQIAEYLERQPAGPPYIAFGYSKGASDLIEAVASEPVARARIAAVVTVAGSVLGSRLAEGGPRAISSTGFKAQGSAHAASATAAASTACGAASG